MAVYSFNPADFHFAWKGNWYTWDHKAAHTAARHMRDETAKRMAAQGRTVTKSSTANQVIRRGGIGTKHPEIDLVVTVYKVTVQ